MDDLVRSVAKCCLGFCLAVVGAGAPAWGAGSDADLPDPTRPGIAEPPSKPVAGGKEPVAEGPVLQSIILRPGRKPAAILSGQSVEVGSEIGGARVTKITEGELVLISPTGKEILKLTPSVDKRAVVEKSSMANKKISGSKQHEAVQ